MSPHVIGIIFLGLCYPIRISVAGTNLGSANQKLSCWDHGTASHTTLNLPSFHIFLISLLWSYSLFKARDKSGVVALELFDTNRPTLASLTGREPPTDDGWNGREEGRRWGRTKRTVRRRCRAEGEGLALSRWPGARERARAFPRARTILSPSACS